ncbi:MAG TPA: OmpH family outer membrane protein [Syntrophorhabdaceae bacterium]|nr:OmpH family outer membrane protein [Syntrophorhabdaceae bacterium]
MKYFVASFFVLGVLLAPHISHGQTMNIVYADLQKIMLESNQGKEIQTTLKAEADKLKKDLDTKQDELQKLKDAIEKQAATITPEARADKEKQYQAKLKDYQRLAGDYQTELQQKDQEYTQKILKEIETIVKNLGEKEKYTLILEKNQAGILFASPTIDITDKVIALFNEAGKKQQPTSKK